MPTITPPPGWGAAPQPLPEDPAAWGLPQPSVWVYAGFWWRVWAFLIDAFILSTAEGILSLFLGPKINVEWEELPIPDGSSQTVDVVNIATTSLPHATPASILIPHLHAGSEWHTFGIVLTLLPMLYCVLFEASSYRATPGKRLCRLEVVTLKGEQISHLRALLRFVIKACLSFPLLYIGVLMVAFTQRKQALHDMIAGTLVLRHTKPAQIVPFPPHN
ncbi:RDD family protein [Acetobacter ghanensis]|uniref:RDD domain containing protein n=1 Tax=Acetobacter ghanensis TaxID=431306 RepID=A0A0U5BG48_9PROT|nr:RDD family protein [Acetobacter ghanensis]NHO39937.1 RDD family protein [Acetobacter ghanensis]CEF53836.1 RDD domain containing protein [Acetobacter ghanensis]